MRLLEQRSSWLQTSYKKTIVWLAHVTREIPKMLVDPLLLHMVSSGLQDLQTQLAASPVCNVFLGPPIVNDCYCWKHQQGDGEEPRFMCSYVMHLAGSNPDPGWPCWNLCKETMVADMVPLNGSFVESCPAVQVKLGLHGSRVNATQTTHSVTAVHPCK